MTSGNMGEREHRFDEREKAEGTWKDWYASRVYFLTNWSKHPTKEAREIAKGEMALLRKATET